MKAAADGVVVHRRTFAVQPRGEQDAARTDRDRCRHRVEHTEEVLGERRTSDVLWLASWTTARAAIRRPAEQVVRKQEVVTKPGEARPPGLVLVGDEVAAGYPRRDGSDVGEGRGLLERHMAADPARRPDVQMAGEVRHRARPTAAECRSPVPVDHRRPLEQARARPRRLASARRARSRSGTSSGSLARSRPAIARSPGSYETGRSRLSVTQCTVIESERPGRNRSGVG